MITLKQSRKGERAEEDLLNKMKGAMSVAATASQYIPVKLDSAKFNPAKLANVGKSMEDLAAKAAAEAQEDAASAFEKVQQTAAEKAADLASNAGGLNSNLTEDSDDDAGLLKILRMIFKIVPIGTNVVKKGKTLAQGFKETALGLANLIKNLAITTLVFGIDTIKFAFELGFYTFKMMICSVGGVLNLHKCILFYLFDLLLLLILLIITSILFMVDMFLGVKAILGMSCVEMLIWGLDLMEKFDAWVFEMFGAHVFHYPDFVLNMCYRCSAMGNTDGFSKASKKMFNDIFVMVPNKIGSPIGNIVRGIGKIFGFFDLG